MTLARLISLVAPPLCWGCGAPAARAAPLMPPARLFPGAAPPLCGGGGAPAARDAPLCGGCRAGLRWLDPEPAGVAGVAAWAPVAYEGPARALVGALKFRAASGL